MGAASLVVKISADINSFSREMNKMTKDVDKAAKKMTELGTALTLGITLPVGLAAVALGKMATENEAVGNKMQREFGPAVERANGLLTKMMQIVPETMTELQKMALATNDFGRGLGLAAPKAELLSENMMKMAADISAKKMMDFNEALDLVQKGLSGQTRGLKGVGIVIDQAQVKQEAYRLGLLHIGRELTPMGTALATYSLMTKQMAQVQGDATASINDTGRQLAFAKRDLLEFFDATSNLMIPAIRLLARVLRGVVDVLNMLPDWIRQTILVFGGLLAVLGPTIIIVAKTTQAIMALRAAMELMAAGSAIRKLIAIFTAPEILLGLAALAVALGIGIALWKKYHKEIETTKPDLGSLIDVKSLMGGASDMSTDNPLQAFQKHAKELMSSVNDLAAMTNDDLGGAFRSIVDLNAQALQLYDKQTDKLGEMAQAARGVAKETQEMISAMIVMSTFKFGSGGMFTQQQHMQMAVGAQSRATTTDNTIGLNISRQMIGDETSLRTREAMLLLPPVFDAVRLSAVNLGEQFRRAHQDFAVSWENFKAGYGQGPSGMSGMGDALGAGLSAGLSSALDALGPFALAAAAVGKVMQGLQPVIDKVLGPLVALGQIIATAITPILKLLFVPLKWLGILVSYVAEILARVSAAIAVTIGTALAAIGRALNKIPFLHLGAGLEASGNALLSYAQSQYQAADQLKRERQQLEGLDFDSAANGLNGLADASNAAAEGIVNASQTFKLEMEKFKARDYDKPPLNLSYGPDSSSSRSVSGSSTSGGISTASLSGDTPLANIQLDSKTIAQVTVDHLRTSAARSFGDASRIKDVVLILG